MIFKSLTLSDGVVIATAKGHPTNVVESFRAVSSILLGQHGRWRITEVNGSCSTHAFHDSDMFWTLRAELKSL